MSAACKPGEDHSDALLTYVCPHCAEGINEKASLLVSAKQLVCNVCSVAVPLSYNERTRMFEEQVDRLAATIACPLTDAF